MQFNPAALKTQYGAMSDIPYKVAGKKGKLKGKKK